MRSAKVAIAVEKSEICRENSDLASQKSAIRKKNSDIVARNSEIPNVEAKFVCASEALPGAELKNLGAEFPRRITEFRLLSGTSGLLSAPPKVRYAEFHPGRRARTIAASLAIHLSEAMTSDSCQRSPKFPPSRSPKNPPSSVVSFPYPSSPPGLWDLWAAPLLAPSKELWETRLLAFSMALSGSIGHSWLVRGRGAAPGSPVPCRARCASAGPPCASP